ncbi:MAG: hypothetical protein Q9179_000999 [Wetmoreana sp. 5 TL-2023]
MDSEDGQTFVKYLAQFVRTHEKALANALQLRRQNPKAGQNVAQTADVSTNLLGGPQVTNPASSVSSVLAAAFSFGALNFTSQSMKPAKLTLTPHHLFYLLSRFEEIGVPVGPLGVRTENLHAEASPANYVSFLGQSQMSQGRSDRDSIHSVTSVRSVMSGMSALWLGFGSSNSAVKSEKAQTQLLVDLKYLYSAFTKIPCLRLSPDRKARLIRGYEEFPFDTAVPLLAFKNLSALEICDVDFRQFFGWDKLADQLRSLTVKRAHLDDPAEIFTSIVLDDMDKRRRRSSKAQSSPVLAWPLSPPVRFVETTKTVPAPDSPVVEDKLGQSTSPHDVGLQHSNSSPQRPTSSRQNASFRHVRSNSKKIKRSGSGSSDSSAQSNPSSVAAYKTGSSSNLLLTGMLPASKWRFLRHLSLADNALTSIPASSLAPLSNNLHSLDLSSNLFTDVPDGLANLTVLRALNLSNCMIASLQSLLRSPLPAITALNLRTNRLNSIVGIERLLSLERLDLRENKLGDPTELARLTGLPELHEVWVLQNPFTRTHSNYRVTIFNLFRSTPGLIDDVTVDGVGPVYGERKHLVDRIVEGEPVSVMRSTTAETDTQLSAVNDTQRDKKSIHDTDAEQSIQDGAAPGSIQDEQHSSAKPTKSTVQRTIGHATARSKRLKKGTKRQRLVDLAADEHTSLNMGQSPLQTISRIPEAKISSVTDISTGSVKLATEGGIMGEVSPIDHSRGPVRASTEDERTKDEIVSPDSPGPDNLTINKDQSLSMLDTHNPRLKAQAYRQKVETLKQEVGSNWLSALRQYNPNLRIRVLPRGVSDMADQNEVDLDSVIDRLLEVRGSRPGKQVQLLETEIRYLCTKAREIFISQPILLELEAPIKASLHLIKLEIQHYPNYLFLGDYVDRGKQSLETICLLLAYKIKYPENFFILRGNHECASINRIYGFYDECKRRYNIKLWKTFTDCFNCLPIAAIIDEKIFTMHGGLSPDLNSMEQIRRVMRPTDIPDCGLLCDLLWSDPDKDITGWSENDRGVSFTFGPDVVSRFLQKHDMDLICRAHQVVEDGYEFFSKRQLVTLFSAPNYCGEFDNAGAMMSVDESLLCSFQILKPAEKKQKYVYGGMNTGRPVTPPRKQKKK